MPASLSVLPEVGMKPMYLNPEFPNYRVNRTSNENRLIHPVTEEWVNAQGYLVAWCAAKHGIELYAVCFWLTHHHLDMGQIAELAKSCADECPRFSDFLTDLHYYLFRIHQAQGWEHGSVMNPRERTDQRPSLDAEQIWWDLVYDTANPVKDGFYEKSSEYPGLCLQPENVTEPVWFVRNRLIDAIRTDDSLFDVERISLQLSIPRPFKHLDPEEYQKEFRTRLDEYEARVRSPRANSEKSTRRLLTRTRGGIIRSRKTRTTSRKGRTRTHNPGVNTTKPALRKAFYKERNDFWDQHREAREFLRSKKTRVAFPPGTYWWRRVLNVDVKSKPDPPVWQLEPPWTPPPSI